MVDVRNKAGKVIYREPPYTELEETELARQMAGIAPDGTCAGFTVLHRAPPDAPPPAPRQKAPPRSPEE